MLWLEAWFAFAAAAFKRHLAYRFANWSGLFTNVFFLLFRAYALAACFAHREQIAGFDAREIVTYVTVTQALIMVVPQWGNIGVAESVRSGQIAMDLVRPFPYVAMQLGQRLGVSAYYVLARCFPILATGLLFGFLHPPPEPRNLPLLLLSVVLAATLANLLLILVELSSFWLGSERGVRYLVMGMSNLFSGLILPVAFFPKAARDLSRVLPFEHTLYTPTRIYLNELDGSLWATLGLQFFWVVLLLGLALLTFRLGSRSLVIQGG